MTPVEFQAHRIKQNRERREREEADERADLIAAGWAPPDVEPSRAWLLAEVERLSARNAELEGLVGALGVYGPTGGPP